MFKSRYLLLFKIFIIDKVFIELEHRKVIDNVDHFEWAFINFLRQKMALLELEPVFIVK